MRPCHLRQLGGELDAGPAAREGLLAEPDVVEAHVVEGLQTALIFGMGEELDRLSTDISSTSAIDFP